MTRVDVHFETGRDVLNAYWGYLSGGGLTLHDGRNHSDPATLQVGQHVDLHVHVGPRREFTVNGRVARIGHGETVIAFDTSESQNQLLAAALSDRSTDMPAHLVLSEMRQRAAAPAHLFEISEDGCCVRLSPEHCAAFNVGAEVIIEAPGFSISGCVVSANDQVRCVIFGLGDDKAVQAVRACVHNNAA